MKEFYRSGEIAQICECSPDTLRHYERLGLIHKPLRSENRYRKYPKETIHRVKQIQAAMKIGFTLKELSKIFKIRDNDGVPCKSVRDLAELKLQQLQKEIEQMVATREQLHQLIKEWDKLLKQKGPGERAGLLDELVHKDIGIRKNSNLNRRIK
jgi:DNA-binding transcriptional MerR regulator